MKEHELRDGLTYVEAAVQAIHESRGDEPLTEDEQAAFDEGVAYIESTRAELRKIEDRKSQVAAIADNPTHTERTGPTVIVKKDPYDVSSSATPAELRDANLRAIEANVDDANMEQAERVFKRHANDSRWSREMLARSRPEYESGFLKAISGREAMLSSEERAALSHSTASQGGYLVPTHLDPSIILTNDGTTNAYRGISRVVSLTNGSQWNGVTSAGVTASFDDTLTEVSDDSPTFGNAQVPLEKAQAFAQASVEAVQDIDGLAGDLTMLFADARDRLEESKFSTGSGTNEPTGVFTTLGATGGSTIAADTQGAIAGADIYEVYESVPVRWRSQATWLGNVKHISSIRQLGTQGDSAVWTQNLRNGVFEFGILGRPVVEDSNAPSTITTTATEDLLILGDFRNLVIVDKPGSMSVQFIPVMFNTANNLPDGRVGWYVNWRTGAKVVNASAFRLLYDPTT